MSELPPNWALVRVGDLVDIGPKNDCPDDTEVGFVPLQRLGIDYRSRHTFELKSWSAIKKGYTHFADGDVLLARITPSFENGKAGIVRSLPNGIGAGSTEYFVCRPIKGALLPEYLLAHFKTPQFLRDGEQVMSGAVGQQRVPKQYVLDSELRLAPFNEQKRIADKLDAGLARVDACRERLDRVTAILKRFRQAVLAAATSGKLTEEWRPSDEIEAWQTVKLSAVAKSRLGKMLDKAKNQGAPTPYLRNINVRWFGFDLSDIQTIRVTEDEARELAVDRGDILICEGGEPGRCAMWQGEDGAYVYQKALHRVRVGPALTPEWLCYSLKDAADSGRLTDLFTGTTIKHLTGVALGQFEFSLPPLREQHEIIRRVETLFAYADRLEACYTTARAQVARLTPALLAKAFRGELVPQDPNDEPAAVLLERIRAARAGAEGTTDPKRRKGNRPKTSRNAEALMFTRKDIEDTHLTTILKERGPLTPEALWSASQLDIDEFYDQLKDEEARGLLREKHGDVSNAPRILEAA